MTITLFKFSKRNNSTKQPSGGSIVSCVLKEDTSVLSPSFILHMNDFDYNYCSWGNRFYYIEDIISMANNYTEIRCRVDALASWKTHIGSSSEYVLRSASAFNGYIPDMLYPVKAKPKETKLVLTTLGSYFQGGSFVVGIVNDDTNSSGAITYYSMSDSQFRNLLHFMFETPTYMQISSAEISENLTKALVDPFQYIKSCVWYPFNIGGYVSNTVKFGWWERTGLTCYIIGESDRVVSHYENVTIPQHPQAAVRGKYLNGSPFRRMSAIVYNFGHIIINPTYFIEGGNMTVQIDTDIFSNSGILRIVDVAGHVVSQSYAPIGVNIPISQLTTNPMSIALDALSGVGGLIVGNVIGYANGLSSAIQDMVPQSQSMGADGSKVAYTMNPTILIEDYSATNDSNIHNGRPLCEERQISTLSGYMVIDNPDADIPCTSYEKDVIMSAMSSGFYYE